MSLEVAVNQHSLQLVYEELSKTLESATARLENFLAERRDAALLKECQSQLKQIAGTLKLIEVEGAAALAGEMHQLLTRIIDLEEFEDRGLGSLSTAFFVLPRYIEFVDKQGADLSLLVVDIINELRLLQKLEPYREFKFAGQSLPVFSETSSLSLPGSRMKPEERAIVFKRVRHLYQTGLLGVLRGGEAGFYLSFMSRATRRLCSLLEPGPQQRFWVLASTVLEAFRQDALSMSLARKRLLGGLERRLRVLISGKTEAPSELLLDEERELLFLLQLSSWQPKAVLQILRSVGIQSLEPADDKVVSIRKEMLGAGYEALSSVRKELQGELHNAKDMLELITQGNITEESELKPLSTALDQIADVLRVLNLAALAELLEQLAQSLYALHGESGYDTPHSLYNDIADALLFVESSVNQLDFRRVDVQSLADIGVERRKEITSGNLLDEAVQLALKESHSGISLAKRAISAYIESDFDTTHVANVAPTLDSIRGAVQIVDMPRLTAILKAAQSFISTFIKQKRDQQAEQRFKLETLADALISIEYYLSQALTKTKADENVLVIAEESLAELGHAVS